MSEASSKAIYFASDFHLGSPDHASSLVREKKIVDWLCQIEKDAAEIYLLGDIFDFWFEYKKVVPRGFVRLLGKLAQLSDRGIKIHVFTGNHDLWMRDYFEEELSIPVYREEIKKTIWGKKFFIAHGDGLGPGDEGYKRLKRVFTNPLCQWMFRQLHPDLSFRIANYWSRKSRESQNEEETYKRAEEEWLFEFAKDELKKEHFDYFIFGHRHLPLNLDLNNQSKYFNLGDWIKHYSYARFDGTKIQLLYYQHT